MGDPAQQFIQKIVKLEINDAEVVAKTAEYLSKMELIYCTRSNTKNNFVLYLNGPEHSLVTAVKWAQDMEITHIAIDINSYLLDFKEGDGYVDEPTMSLVSYAVFHAHLTIMMRFADRASELLRSYNPVEVKLILSIAQNMEFSHPAFNYYDNKLYKLVKASMDYNEQKKKIISGTNDK